MFQLGSLIVNHKNRKLTVLRQVGVEVKFQGMLHEFLALSERNASFRLRVLTP